MRLEREQTREGEEQDRSDGQTPSPEPVLVEGLRARLAEPCFQSTDAGSMLYFGRSHRGWLRFQVRCTLWILPILPSHQLIGFPDVRYAALLHPHLHDAIRAPLRLQDGRGLRTPRE